MHPFAWCCETSLSNVKFLRPLASSKNTFLPPHRSHTARIYMAATEINGKNGRSHCMWEENARNMQGLSFSLQISSNITSFDLYESRRTIKMGNHGKLRITTRSSTNSRKTFPTHPDLIFLSNLRFRDSVKEDDQLALDPIHLRHVGFLARQKQC